MKLRDTIRACQKCPLYNNMETSPIPPEWRGHPKVAFVIDNMITDQHDLLQETITGVNRTRFLSLIKEAGVEDYYLTNLVKCAPTNKYYRVAHIKTCIEWLVYEFEILKPEIIIGCGPKTTVIKADFYFKSVGIITSSKKEEQSFVDQLRIAAKNDK